MPAGPVRIAPSILSADLARLGEQVHEAEAAGADRIHVDVMDGHFVPNLTFGPATVKWLRRVTELPLEVHLMIQRPGDFLEPFARAGAATLIVHTETVPDLPAMVQRIKGLGLKAGVTVKPATPLSTAEAVLGDIDLLLIMTVNPGFGGQAFMPETLPKLRDARQALDARGRRCDLEVDGGIDDATAPQVVAAGADVLVAGNSVYGAKDGIAAAMTRLRTAAHAT